MPAKHRQLWLFANLSLLFFAGIVALSVVFYSQHQASAAHDERFLENYFALPFIEDIPNGGDRVRVAECAGQGHSDARIIDSAIARWNGTNRVEYWRDTANPTITCDVDGWPPALSGVVAVSHRGTRSFFQADTTNDVSRQNDWGPEADTLDPIGMQAMTRARIWIASDGIDISAHELGHGTGLSDLYSPDYECAPSCPPCTDVTTYGTPTVMDCSTDHGSSIPSVDVTSLNLMYQRIPQAIPTGVNDWRVVGTPTYNSISFAWTDYSFNEKDQIITRTSDSATEIAPRDAQAWTWSGLNSSTNYCFNIKQRNAYGGTATASPNVCATTAASPFDLQATNYSPHKPTSQSGTTAVNEGSTATQFVLSVKNNGTQPAPSTWVKIQFAGADPPPGGICNIPSIGAGATVTCTTGAVNWTTLFGGPVTVIADYNGLVSESNEGNNTFAWGTVAVKPTAPDNARICNPACDLFGYDDDSSIESGFGIIIQKRSTSCSSGTWSTYDQFLHPAKGGTDDVYFYNFPAGAFRIKVQALGLLAGPHSSTDTSTCVFFSS